MFKNIYQIEKCIGNYFEKSRGTPVVMVFVIGNGHGDSSSNPRISCLHFTLH